MCECVCPVKTSYAPIVPDSYVSYEHRAIKLSDRMKSLAVHNRNRYAFKFSLAVYELSSTVVTTRFRHFHIYSH